MSANQFLEESLIRHQIFLLRFAGTSARELKRLLRQLQKDVNARLIEATTDFQIARLGAASAEIDALVAEMDTAGVVAKSATDLADYEVDFALRLYESAATVELSGINSQLVIASATTKPIELVVGKETVITSIDAMIRDFDSAAAREIKLAIQTGIVNGDPIDKIARDITRLTNGQLFRNAEALARTVNLHVGSVARQSFYEANSDIIKDELFVATLDSRTTLICAGFDGKTFPIGQGPIPPLHWRCRSVRVGRLDDRFGLADLGGQRPQVGSAGPGTTSSRTTFNSFFGRQSEAWQKEYLGPKRWELYKKGQLNINQFTDDLGKALTIDQLKAREGLTMGD